MVMTLAPIFFSENNTVDSESEGSSSSPPSAYFSYAERLVIAAILVLVAAVGLFGNTLVITSVILSRRLHRTTNLFILNLSLTDLLTCIFLPVQSVVVLTHRESPLPDALCTFVGSLSVICLACSVNSLLCIALNRFFLIIKDRTTYCNIYTLRYSICMTLATWLLPTTSVAIPAATGFVVFGFDPKDSSCTWIAAKSSPYYSLLVFFTCIPLQFTLILWSYIKVFRFIRKHTRAVAHLDHDSKTPGRDIIQVTQIGRSDSVDQPPCRRTPHLKLQFKVTKNLFLVVVIFMLCVTPFGISLALARFSPSNKLTPFTATLLTINSCMNPIIYGFRHPHFRIVFKCIITGHFSNIPERVKFPWG